MQSAVLCLFEGPLSRILGSCRPCMHPAVGVFFASTHASTTDMPHRATRKSKPGQCEERTLVDDLIRCKATPGCAAARAAPIRRHIRRGVFRAAADRGVTVPATSAQQVLVDLFVRHDPFPRFITMRQAENVAYIA
jgi:hypothetical protein